MQNTQEIWKDIQGYESLYQVSNLGNVFSKRKKKIVKGCIMKDGYYDVLLCSDKQRHFKRHRLVAMAFLPNPDNKETVNHKDGNKANNCAANLEWSTQSENNIHSIHTLKRGKRSFKHKGNKLTKESVLNIKVMFLFGASLESIAIKHNIHKEHARRVVKGHHWNIPA